MAGVPTSSVSAVAPMLSGPDRADESDGRRADQQRERGGADAERLHVHEQAEQRCRNHQRQNAAHPVRQALHQHRQRQHVAVIAQHQKIERTVFAIGLKQPVEAEQAGEQSADPKDRRTDAGEQLQVRSDTEGDGGDDGEEEDDAGERPAPGTD
ncbi:hypothetical protein X753_25790 [Mesorhizobium sp. LNJC399B00]|nr:hypothetical protein X753_25790 [Mesorhizobium sp. LNJC399B00]